MQSTFLAIVSVFPRRPAARSFSALPLVYVFDYLLKSLSLLAACLVRMQATYAAVARIYIRDLQGVGYGERDGDGEGGGGGEESRELDLRSADPLRQ